VINAGYIVCHKSYPDPGCQKKHWRPGLNMKDQKEGKNRIVHILILQYFAAIGAVFWKDLWYNDCIHFTNRAQTDHIKNRIRSLQL
jgi:hypothetical protein